MMLLFFKAIYRDPILRGEKTDTIRANRHLPRVGSLVRACVGPSRIFATLQIIEATPVASLPPERASQVSGCYGAIPPDAVRLTFRLVSDATHAAA